MRGDFLGRWVAQGWTADGIGFALPILVQEARAHIMVGPAPRFVIDASLACIGLAGLYVSVIAIMDAPVRCIAWIALSLAHNSTEEVMYITPWIL